MSYGVQVNCFVLSISTLFINRLAAVGVHLQNKRSIVSQRQHQQEGLKVPWRRKPAQLASDSPRSVCTTLHVCVAADYISLMYMVRPGTFHPTITAPLPPLTTACLLRRVSAASAACQEAVEQGLAAEHRLNMRLAVQCFEVNSTSVLPARSARYCSCPHPDQQVFWLCLQAHLHSPHSAFAGDGQLLQLFTSRSMVTSKSPSVLVLHTSTS